MSSNPTWPPPYSLAQCIERLAPPLALACCARGRRPPPYSLAQCIERLAPPPGFGLLRQGPPTAQVAAVTAQTRAAGHVNSRRGGLRCSCRATIAPRGYMAGAV
jgi:hypothetical protein